MSIKRLGYLGAGETHGALRTSHADLVLVALADYGSVTRLHRRTHGSYGVSSVNETGHHKRTN
jgi:hypothetical protein